MYFIKMDIDGTAKYLLNYRCAVFLPDYAMRFQTMEDAMKYLDCEGKAVSQEHTCWIVKEPEPERYLNLDGKL